MNTLPTFLVNLAQALAPDDPRTLASDSTSIAQEHGGERARLSDFAPEDIIREYQILRECILKVVKGKTTLNEEEGSIIHRSIDMAMTEAMTSYFLVLNNLRERLSLFMSYDIRKPLESIRGKALLIKKNPTKTEWTPELAAGIAGMVDQIEHLIDEMLRPVEPHQDERLRFPLAKGDLNEILRQTIDNLNLRYGGRFEYTGEKIIGYWNADSLRKALESLCTNVLSYGTKTRVKVTLEKVDSRILLSVHNPSKVIPASQHEFLFQSFRRSGKGPAKNHYRGWGIGLPLARGVAEAHGGSLGVDSSNEKGTTIILDIMVDSRPYQPTHLTPGTIDPREKSPHASGLSEEEAGPPPQHHRERDGDSEGQSQRSS